MNERIKELAKQSLPEFYLTNCPSALEKFAELIIWECIKQAHGVANLRGVKDDMVYGADTAAVMISRHFGVTK